MAAKRLGVDEVLRRGRGRSQREHEVGGRQQLFEARLLEAVDGGVRDRIADDHVHAHTAQQVRQVRADRAVADDARSAPAQLTSGSLRWCDAGAVVDRRLADIARQIEHQSEGQFRSRWYEALVGVTDDHPGRACRRNVDRADVDGASQEGQQARQRIEQIRFARLWIGGR